MDVRIQADDDAGKIGIVSDFYCDEVFLANVLVGALYQYCRSAKVDLNVMMAALGKAFKETQLDDNMNDFIN